MNQATGHCVEVVDSHTGGEPTRVVIAGGPDLGSGPGSGMRETAMAERLALLRGRHDWLRSAIINEPRGSDALVGALLCPPANPANIAGAIFFNNVGYLGMCGHGTIGLAVTLAFLGRLEPGTHRLETPPGEVGLTLHDNNRVTVGNVPSFRHRRGQMLRTPEFGEVCGDIAWGGNWFFLVSDHGRRLEYDNVEELGAYARVIQRELEQQGIRGPGGELIDHVELFGPASENSRADSRNFVMCPGGAYDRSPCGTGTSAKVACLIEDGELAPGQVWRQESITGSVFEARAARRDGRIVPEITGSAHITGRSTLILDPADPFRHGIGKL
ncbi:MAG: proline racemase family protein [Gammaproteobacteria bacterium]|nr:proline racemase family protein [Gammaproteobacteria bacterium]